MSATATLALPFPVAPPVKVAANPEARKIASYPLFDGLRFVLASVVVLVHADVHFPAPIDGNLAVRVFLALSGWLIGGILLETQRSELPRFFYNRATRIWCPYFATMILLYATAALFRGIDLNWFKYLFYDATFTHYTWTVFPRASAEMPLQGTGNHFWSIAVEEQFYLFAPMLMLLFTRGKTMVTWAIVAALLLFQGSQFAPIALGVLAAIVHRNYGINAQGIAWNERYRGPAIAAVAAAVLLIATAYWPTAQLRSLFAVAVVLAASIQGRRGPNGMFLGAISYPLYLNHWIGAFVVHSAAKRLGYGPSATQQALSYCIAISVAIVAWYAIDRQVMAYRNGWYTPALGRALGITAYALLAVGLVGGFIIQRMGG